MTSRVVKVQDNRPQMLARLRQLKRHSLTVGVHSDAGVSADGTSMALIAGVHEFGAPSVNVPERAPIRKTIEAERPVYRRYMRRVARLYVIRGVALRPMLDRVGLKVSADIQATIRAGLTPGLAPSTIARREAKLGGRGAANNVFGGWTPLIDTGRLINSYRHKVSES